LFDSDLKDENARLRQDLATERLRVSELTKAVIALSDRTAFHSLYPREKKETVIQKALTPPPPMDPRKVLYKPRLSYEDVSEVMARREEEGKL